MIRIRFFFVVGEFRDIFRAQGILRVVRDKVGLYLCRSQVMLMTTYKFLPWVHSTRWMDESVVPSEKCWIGIEEKMPEISGCIE